MMDFILLLKSELQMNKTLKYIIVEDSKIDELHLYSMLLKYKSLEFVGKAATGPDAITLIQTQEPEVIFMDIKIKGGSGIEIARLLKQSIRIIIFVSSYSEFAVEGFELCALDYLLKPVSTERLEVTHSRIWEYWSMKELERAQMLYAQKDSIIIKANDHEIELKTREIVYLEAMQDYTKVVTIADKFLVSDILSHFLEQQMPDVFIQVHRRYAVVRKNIKTVEGNNVICDHCVLPIGRIFLAEMNQFKV